MPVGEIVDLGMWKVEYDKIFAGAGVRFSSGADD